jgi:methionyl aminopeptidase
MQPLKAWFQPGNHELATQALLALTAPIIKLGRQITLFGPFFTRRHDPPMSYIEATDTSLRKTGQIKLHGPSGFAGMRKAGALVAKCLDELTDIVKPGVPTSDIDEFVREFAFRHGAYPATLMYRGYRYSTCTSINHVVCHGMPGDRALKEGDVVNIDVTFIVEGWYGDSSRMYAVGPIARKAERLIEVTYEAMMRGIAAVKPGAMFHDEPNIIHIGRPGEGVTLKPGMFFTIEPMINLGKPHVKILSDGWTAVTRDRSLSAQFEHSVGVTSTGVEIFTLSQRHGEKPPGVG